MPSFPHPARGEQPFPRSRGWPGTPWAGVIDHHIRGHAASGGGGDYVIGFDDDDRLCVKCRGEKGYATRIPLPLVDWTEREMEAAGITAVPNHPRQFRLQRGEGMSRLSDAPAPPSQVLREDMATRCGVAPADILTWPGEDVVNLSIDGEGPVLYRHTAMDRHQVAWLERLDNTWWAFTGVIDGREADVVKGGWATKDVRQIRGGSVINWMLDRLETNVVRDAELARMMTPGEADDAPDGP